MRGYKHPIDETYFDKIDSPRKAYWLGMMYADGCNKSNGNIILGLSGEDRYMLEALKADLRFGGDIYQAKSYPVHKKIPYRLEFQNKRMSRDLFRQGVLHNKSLILKFPTPEQVNHCFMPHFLRGYFDGDGHVGKNKTRLEASITSSPDFCESVKSFLEETLKTKVYLKKKKDTLACTSYLCGRSAVIFLDYIYKDEGIRLKRKYDKFKTYLDDCIYRTSECGSSFSNVEYGLLVDRWKNLA